MRLSPQIFRDRQRDRDSYYLSILRSRTIFVFFLNFKITIKDFTHCYCSNAIVVLFSSAYGYALIGHVTLLHLSNSNVRTVLLGAKCNTWAETTARLHNWLKADSYNHTTTQMQTGQNVLDSTIMDCQFCFT